jgi:hypothetical protein
MEILSEEVDVSSNSSFYEQLVEHTFISEVLQEACFKYRDTIEVLRSEVDAYGYDLVLEFRGVVRHVQLKTSKQDAATRNQKVALNLGEKAGGCIVWIERFKNALKNRIELKYRFFGKNPDEKLKIELEKKDDKGNWVYKIAKHTKGNKEGVKAERAKHREVPKSAFRDSGRLMDMEELFLILFEK